MRTIFSSYRDHKKWTKGTILPAEAEGRGWQWFPRFIFCDQDNWKKLSETWKFIYEAAWNRKNQCNRVLFCIFPITIREKFYFIVNKAYFGQLWDNSIQQFMYSTKAGIMQKKLFHKFYFPLVPGIGSKLPLKPKIGSWVRGFMLFMAPYIFVGDHS